MRRGLGASERRGNRGEREMRLNLYAARGSGWPAREREVEIGAEREPWGRRRNGSGLGQCCSDFHRHTNPPPPTPPGLWLKHDFWSSHSGWGLRVCISNRLPGGTYAVGPRTTLWEARAWKAEGANHELWAAQRGAVHLTVWACKLLGLPDDRRHCFIKWEAIWSQPVIFGKLCGEKEVRVLSLVDTGVNLRELSVCLVGDGEALRV